MRLQENLAVYLVVCFQLIARPILGSDCPDWFTSRGRMNPAKVDARLVAMGSSHT